MYKILQYDMWISTFSVSERNKTYYVILKQMPTPSPQQTSVWDIFKSTLLFSWAGIKVMLLKPSVVTIMRIHRLINK